MRLYRASDLARAEAPRASVDVTGRTINDRLHALDIRLPHTVGTAMRVADVDTERNTLAAELTLSHPLHLPRSK